MPTCANTAGTGDYAEFLPVRGEVAASRTDQLVRPVRLDRPAEVIGD